MAPWVLSSYSLVTTAATGYGPAAAGAADASMMPSWAVQRYPVAVVLQRIPGRVSLLALRCLANVLSVLVHEVFPDRKRATAVLLSTLAHVFPVLSSRDQDNLSHALAAVNCLSSLSVSQFKYSLVAWQQDAWNAFTHRDFFKTSECPHLHCD